MSESNFDSEELSKKAVVFTIGLVAVVLVGWFFFFGGQSALEKKFFTTNPYAPLDAKDPYQETYGQANELDTGQVLDGQQNADAEIPVDNENVDEETGTVNGQTQNGGLPTNQGSNGSLGSGNTGSTGNGTGTGNGSQTTADEDAEQTSELSCTDLEGRNCEAGQTCNGDTHPAQDNPQCCFGQCV